jgi:hypothetical protein
MVLIQIKCPSSRDFSLTKSDRDEIAVDLRGELDVFCLPSKGQEPFTGDPFQGGHYTEIIAYLVGAEIARIFLKPFLESMLQEAGKEAWPKLKKLIIKLWKKQRQQSRNFLGSSAYMVIELFDEYIIFPFELVGKTDEEVSANLEREFLTMLASADQISKRIKQIRDSQPDHYLSPSRMHILFKKEDGKYDVQFYMDYDSNRFNTFN